MSKNSINHLLDNIERQLIQIKAALTPTKAVRVKKVNESPDIYTTQIEKLFRYWKRPLTATRAWQLMQKRNYTDSASPIPPKAFVSALKSNFLALGDNRYTMTLS